MDDRRAVFTLHAAMAAVIAVTQSRVPSDRLYNTRSVGLSHRSGSRRVNCQATATADRTSIVESSPNPTKAAEDATVPAVIAMIASMML